MLDISAVQELLGRWWVDYDEGRFDEWPAMVADDARFTCRSDSGATEYEEFIRADVTGKDAFLAWQTDHRKNSPYPLRHNGTNIHITGRSGDEVTFDSYIFVTQIVAGAVSNLSTGHCHGTVRMEGGAARIAAMHVVLDTMDSEVFATRPPT